MSACRFKSGLFRHLIIRRGRETVEVSKKGFILCPKCGQQTKTKVRPDTELKRFPLFCPWCKKETIIDK